MSIAAVIKRNAKQDAVYWGNPVKDGQGGFTFDDPVEIKCRWEDMVQLVSDRNGVQQTSRALVYPLIDLDEDGMLYLGTLDDLTQAQIDDPMSFKDAFAIKRFEKDPLLSSTTVFLRKAYLTPSLSFGGF